MMWSRSVAARDFASFPWYPKNNCAMLGSSILRYLEIVKLFFARASYTFSAQLTHGSFPTRSVWTFLHAAWVQFSCTLGRWPAGLSWLIMMWPSLLPSQPCQIHTEALRISILAALRGRNKRLWALLAALVFSGDGPPNFRMKDGSKSLTSVSGD